MRYAKRTTETLILGVAMAVSASSLPRMAAAAQSPNSIAPDDAVPSRDAEARLNKSQFNAVKVQVEGGIATMSGTVSLYEYKVDAEKRVFVPRALRAHGI